jgi:succinate dehydrogenase / fumarate reductase cytochrome b subunit
MTTTHSLSGLIGSSVGKKLMSGLTGLALVGFVVVHLLGNLTLFIGAEAMNTYSYTLQNAAGGYLVYVAEAILSLVFLVHIVSGIQVALSKSRARPAGSRYTITANAGATSRKSSSSTTMIYTGVLLLAFVIFHLISFKFGPSESDGYIAVYDGVEMRDMYRLVVERFKNPLYTFGYVTMMALLGWHLRHGIWSAFQSLGLNNRKLLPLTTALGGVLAVALAVGFIVLPLYVYWFALAG